MHWAFCHFVGYSKSEDEWRPFHKMSVGAMGVAATSSQSCSPKYCKRLQNQGKDQDVNTHDPDRTTSSPAHAILAQVADHDNYDAALKLLSTIHLPVEKPPPSPSARRVDLLPPVPVFSPSTPPQPPASPRHAYHDSNHFYSNSSRSRKQKREREQP
jgi:hypothetical protein